MERVDKQSDVAVEGEMSRTLWLTRRRFVSSDWSKCQASRQCRTKTVVEVHDGDMSSSVETFENRDRAEPEARTERRQCEEHQTRRLISKENQKRGGRDGGSIAMTFLHV